MVLSLYDRARIEGWRVDLVTFSTLIKIYGVSGNFDGALNVYEEMKALGVKPNLVTYNTLLDAMGRGKRPWKANGKVSEAENMLNEMLETGFEPNIYVLTSIIQCYGKANQTDDVVRAFDRHQDLGITPDDQFCGCLLNVMTQTPKEKLGKLIGCIESANPKLGKLVKHLVEEESNNEVLRQEASLIFDVISKDESSEFHKRSFESIVDSVCAIAASHLWQLVVVRADLNRHLKAIKDYFLLAKGDFSRLNNLN
ncbi:hypothetical protein GIB67_012046 [Kingdonia uniflora]|uniref:Pentatricopeptide repeat-containing protein n=1 Tax=Kingdonia uniflora TaxID=39325 RepID=A0A7J7M064_9MAGN|nr:hypothetical protein GIB67_012046 [Kingdonia uniflora]